MRGQILRIGEQENLAILLSIPHGFQVGLLPSHF